MDPHDIPNGYNIDKHTALEATIREGLESMTGPLRIMACHATQETHCVGWLMNQLGVGNNIGLRFAMMDCENLGHVVLVGDQHERFEDTLPDN